MSRSETAVGVSESTLSVCALSSGQADRAQTSTLHSSCNPVPDCAGQVSSSFCVYLRLPTVAQPSASGAFCFVNNLLPSCWFYSANARLARQSGSRNPRLPAKLSRLTDFWRLAAVDQATSIAQLATIVARLRSSPVGPIAQLGAGASGWIWWRPLGGSASEATGAGLSWSYAPKTIHCNCFNSRRRRRRRCCCSQLRAQTWPIFSLELAQREASRVCSLA